MRYLPTFVLAIGLIAVFQLAGTAAEGELSPQVVAIRIVQSGIEPLLEVKIGRVVFLTRYLEIPPHDGWPGKGEIYSNGERVTWRNGGIETGAALIAFNLKTHSIYESGDPAVAISGDLSSRGTAATHDMLTIRCAKTMSTKMVEIKCGGMVAVTPFLTFVSVGRQTEIRSIGEKLESRDGQTIATFTSMTFDP